MRAEFDRQATEVEVPEDLQEQVRTILDEHSDLRWDDAVQIVLDETRLDHVRAEKQKTKKKSGDFTGTDEEE
jgi:macrodomain Ter protein organizer (MatP/YcbG family)